jgi:hypothetical protein
MSNGVIITALICGTLLLMTIISNVGGRKK